MNLTSDTNELLKFSALVPAVHRGCAGVYIWICTASGSVYIGSSKELYARNRRHAQNLAKGKHPAKHFQNSYDKYGCGAFELRILEVCAPELRIEREQAWLDQFEKHRLLNGIDKAVISRDFTRPNMKGVARSPECREKIRLALLGRKTGPRSGDVRKKISAALKGRSHPGTTSGPLSDDHRRKIGDANRGKKHTDEAKKKISIASRGRRYSEQAKENMKRAQRLRREREQLAK